MNGLSASTYHCSGICPSYLTDLSHLALAVHILLLVKQFGALVP